MANQQLIDYVKQSRGAGIEDSAIRQALLGSGYSVQDIEEALVAENPKSESLNPKQSQNPKFKFPKLIIKLVVVILIVVTVVIGGYFVLAQYFPQYVKYVQPYLGPVLDPVMDIVGLTQPINDNITNPQGPNLTEDTLTPTPSPTLNLIPENIITTSPTPTQAVAVPISSQPITQQSISLLYTKSGGIYSYNINTKKETLLQAGSFDWTLLKAGNANELKIAKSPDSKKIAVVRERNGVWVFLGGDKPEFYELLDTPQGLPFVTSVFFSDDSNEVNSYHYEENQYDETNWQKMEDGFYVTITNLANKGNKTLLAVPKKEFPNIDKVLSKPGLCGVSNFLYYDKNRSNLYILLTANTSIMCDIAVYNTKTKTVTRIDIPKDVYLQDYRFHIGKTLSPSRNAFVASGDLPLNILAAVNVKNGQIVKMDLSDEEKKMSMLGRIIWKSDNELVYSFMQIKDENNSLVVIRNKNLISGTVENLANVSLSQLEDVLPTDQMLLKSSKDGFIYILDKMGTKTEIPVGKINTYIGWVKN